jgi:hypothetical protein
MAASSHVLSSISHGVTQWVYGGGLFVVSARTNKRHDHHCTGRPEQVQGLQGAPPEHVIRTHTYDS